MFYDTRRGVFKEQPQIQLKYLSEIISLDKILRISSNPIFAIYVQHPRPLKRLHVWQSASALNDFYPGLIVKAIKSRGQYSSARVGGRWPGLFGRRKETRRAASVPPAAPMNLWTPLSRNVKDREERDEIVVCDYYSRRDARLTKWATTYFWVTAF